MGIKSSILNNVSSTLEGITTANGYSLDIKYVGDARIPADKLTAQQRIAAVTVNLIREDKSLQGEHESSNDQMLVAHCQFRVEAIMENATHAAFLDFLEDIEAVLSKDETRNSVVGDYHHVQRTWISGIDFIEPEEFNTERIQEATIVLNVQYQYIPLMLSATGTDRQG